MIDIPKHVIMKEYCMLLVYTDPDKLSEFLEEKKAECTESWEYNQKTSTFCQITKDPFITSDEIVMVKWTLARYTGEYIDRPSGLNPKYDNVAYRWAWQFAAHQFYSIWFLDGVVDAWTINYLLSRVRWV